MLGFKIILFNFLILLTTYKKTHRICAIGRQYGQCNMESECTYVSMFILGEREREDEREREEKTNREKKLWARIDDNTVICLHVEARKIELSSPKTSVDRYLPYTCI